MDDREHEQFLAEYERLIAAISDEPCVEPTAAESAALARALSEIELRPVSDRVPAPAVPQGLPGFALASAVAFVVIAAILGMQAFGVISILAIASAIGPVTIALSAIIVVFVTSFVPIAVTARRRPLNGMTFRR